ncbi:hypothetical protein M8J75_006631 [Diaphorina citri]|nr:hypothetical protein M8J75_006631 [Diaphorina citri]KAI5734348.1 hypothetical protein M8J77_005309 [Diaphorina citri]
MSDNFFSRSFLPSFIDLYRQQPCLWRVKCKDHSNIDKRNLAYNVLLEFTKTHIPECDSAYVKKKIDTMRGSYRREKKKVKASKGTGSSTDGVYIPKLWYYHLLDFLADEEKVRSSISTLDPPTQALESDAPPSVDRNDEEIDVELLEEETIDANVIIPPTNPRKRSRPSGDGNTTSQILEKAMKFLEKDQDEYDMIGGNVTAKLRKMDSTQALLAESLIGQVLMAGVLNKLTTSSTLSITPFQSDRSASATPYYTSESKHDAAP